MKLETLKTQLTKRNGTYYKIGYLSVDGNYSKESEMLVRVGINYANTKDHLDKVASGKVSATRKSPIANTIIKNTIVETTTGKVCLIAYPTKNSHIKTISKYRKNDILITKEQYYEETNKKPSTYAPLFYLDLEKIQWIK